MSNIIPFKIPSITVSACCSTCEATWVTEMPVDRYKKYTNGNKKHICQFCGDFEVDFAKKTDNN